MASSTRDECLEVWLGNLKPCVSEQDISEFLIDCGYSSFLITMGPVYHKVQDVSFCIVEMEDFYDADRALNNLRGLKAPVKNACHTDGHNAKINDHL